jgi:hypothetical protein
MVRRHRRTCRCGSNELTPTITVDTGVLDGAGDSTIGAAATFIKAVQAALGALGGAGGMTGTDPAGLVVGEHYDNAASSTVVAIVDSTNGTSRIGDLLKMSAYNYAIANHYSAIKPSGGPPTKPTATKPFSSHVPPKGEGSLSSAPFGWGLIQSIIGMVWPNGDPGKMRAAAAAWTSLSNAASTFDAALVGPETQAKGQEIPEQASIATAFSDATNSVTGLGRTASSIAGQLNAYAQHVDDAHQHLRQLIQDALHLATPAGVLQEVWSVVTDKEDQLRKIAHEAEQVLHDLKTEADAVGTLLQPLVQQAEQAGKAMLNWAGAALQDAADIGQAIAADVLNSAATYGNAALHNPLDALGMIGGAALMAGGAGIEVPGVVLDATGVGAFVGVPVNVAGAAMMAGGATMAGAGALDLSHAAEQQPVTVFHAHTGRPGEGIDRGDGRDPYGHITGRGGGGYGRQREAEGIEKYKQANEGRWVTTEQRKATVEGAPNGRFYDGLAKKPDGTYEGIEVKSGTAGLTKPQESFDGKVGYNNPGYVTITNDQGEVETVQVTSTRVETVPAE